MKRTLTKLKLSPEARKDLYDRAKRQDVKPFAVVEELLRWSKHLEMLFDPIRAAAETIGHTDAMTDVWEKHSPAAVAGRRSPEVSERPLRPPAALRDPEAPDAPEWVQHAARMVQTAGGAGLQQEADLRTWMMGNKIETPGWWTMMALDMPPIRNPVPLPERDDTNPPPPEATFVSSQPEEEAPVPDVPLPGDLTAGMGDDVKTSKMDEPGYEFPKAFVPTAIVREWTDANAPPWVAKVGEAIADGDSRADGGPTKALIRWRRGEDVAAPEGW